MDEIYQKYAQTVYRYLLSLTCNADLAEELTQETFYQAIRSSGKYNGSCKLSTWLCGISRNVLRTYRRKHPETQSPDPAAGPDALQNAETLPAERSSETGSAEDAALQSEDRVEIFRSLHEVSEPYREVMYLRIFGNLSFREIGGILGQTENWARVTFYRGREKLAAKLADRRK